MFELPQDIRVFERGWLSSNNILFLAGQANTLVDSGYASHAQQTCQLIHASLGDAPLHQLVNTHLHSDHCGGNAALQATWPQVRTLIPPGLAGSVRHWDRVTLSYEPTGQQCPPFKFEATLTPGSVVRCGVRELQVLAAPGHDPHAVVLFEPELGLLLSADALWENGFGVVFPQLDSEVGFDEVSQTLDLMESLAVRCVIPGHGSPFTDVASALQRARARLRKYQADPIFHARYAAKVLIKFRLLEVQRETLHDLLRWLDQTPYFKTLHQRFSVAMPWINWTQELLSDLQRAGALQMQDGWVLNL